MTHDEKMVPEFSRPFLVDHLGVGEKQLMLTATPDECAALAERMGILSVSGLTAQVRLKRRGPHVIRVTGQLSSDVVQRCGVTLEPVVQQVTESFDLTFTDQPPDDPDLDLRDIDIDAFADDPPELIEGGAIDLGELAAEALALGLDPFPRAAGAAFTEWEDPEEDEEKPKSPFAALAALKKT